MSAAQQKVPHISLTYDISVTAEVMISADLHVSYYQKLSIY